MTHFPHFYKGIVVSAILLTSAAVFAQNPVSGTDSIAGHFIKSLRLDRKETIYVHTDKSFTSSTTPSGIKPIACRLFRISLHVIVPLCL